MTCVLSRIRRFLHNACSPASEKDTSDVLTSGEIQATRIYLLKMSQQNTFTDVLESFHSGKKLPSGHPLAKLDISLDSTHLLRVSGRVRDPVSSQNPKFLVVLSLKSPLTKLLLSTLHISYNHPSISTLLSIVAENYHIPGIRNFIKFLSRQSAHSCQPSRFSRDLLAFLGHSRIPPGLQIYPGVSCLCPSPRPLSANSSSVPKLL